MRTLLSRIFVFWKPDVEFTTPLSIDICRNRLENLGATTGNGMHWFWSRSNSKRVFFSLNGRGYSFFKDGPGISGNLQETEDGTKVTGSFWPVKPLANITALLSLACYFVFWQKNFLLASLFLLILFINLGFIYSFLSDWEGLEIKLHKNLKSWKKYK